MAERRIIAIDHGGPEVLQAETFDLPAPGRGEVVLRQAAAGVNFIDTYHRSGLYPSSVRPIPIGSEGAGTIEAVGEGVTGWAPGDRAAYAGATGAYATTRIIAADQLVRVPDGITDETAAAALLKGMTAAFLVGPCARIEAGQTVLVHAAAGGVGSILVQWLSAEGATVIAHAGSAEKAERAKALGAAHALHGPMDELAAAVRAIVSEGCPVVLDGVGKASWAASLASAAKRGLIVSYGNASGAVPPVSLLDLSRGGSLFVTRPTLFDYARTPDERQALADALWARIADGRVRIDVTQRFALDDAAEAHRALEGRRTTGSVLLIP